jgi:hypothetical protein
MLLPIEAIARLANLAAELEQQIIELRALRRAVRLQMVRRARRRRAKEGRAEVALMHSRSYRYSDRPNPR